MIRSIKGPLPKYLVLIKIPKQAVLMKKRMDNLSTTKGINTPKTLKRVKIRRKAKY